MPAAHSDPALPGITHVDAELQAQLDAARQRLGPDYRARTEHLEQDGSPTYTNRLILQTSPYLLQHAHNPVNWFAWGVEAFEKAKALHRPVLLSVGYSTCHWCHVMERESFENEEIARVINERFVPIKVDREERPDVDELYMTAVQLLAGRGGWPMTVILTPDADPFFAGTYFPPRDGSRGARRGFLSILNEMADRYRDDPGSVLADAQELSQRIQALSAPRPPSGVPSSEAITNAANALVARLDQRHGGFGRAPKFPQPSQLGLLLRYARRSSSRAALHAVELTLEKMAGGGIYDQVGGGFHRYSTDARWLVPHFEKMLYDNAQLASIYLQAFQVTGREDFAQIARQTLDYVSREMSSEQGLFYSATDADSPIRAGSLEMEEGLFFTWTADQLRGELDDTVASRAFAYWAVEPRGNFEGRSILHAPRSLEEVATELDIGTAELRESIEQARSHLYQVRAERPAPLRDDKALAAWNGLMLSAFAQAALVLADDRYLERATHAANGILEHLRTANGRLARSFMHAEANHTGFLQDYAFVIAGLIDLYEASGQERWIGQALRLQAELDTHFGREAGGYWMTGRDAEQLLAKEMPSYDGAIPSGNAVAANNLLRLASLRSDDALRRRAERVFSAFGAELASRGQGMTHMLSALDRYLDRQLEVVIVFRTPQAAEPFLSVLRSMYLPNRTLCLVPHSNAADVAAAIPLVEHKGLMGDADVTAYVCERGRCELPTSDPVTFARQLGPVQPL